MLWHGMALARSIFFLSFFLSSSFIVAVEACKIVFCWRFLWFLELVWFV